MISAPDAALAHARRGLLKDVARKLFRGNLCGLIGADGSGIKRRRING